jgi:hypothetical protein
MAGLLDYFPAFKTRGLKDFDLKTTKGFHGIVPPS